MLKEIIYKYAIKNAFDYGKARVNAVISKVIAEAPEVRKNIKEVVEKVKEIVEKVNKMSREEIEEEVKKFTYAKREERKGLPPLKNANKVVLRVAPFPSGALHIGNCRILIINDEYRKMYNGKLYIVIDDTIGSESKPIVKEAYDLIIDGINWLGIKYDKVIYKSDRLQIYYEYGKKLIEKGYAYVCNCDRETIRKLRREGKECEHRKRSVEENLKEWEKMFTHYKEGEAVLRLKTSMQHKNPAFRDRILFRITNREHPRVKAKVWPTMEFTWAIDDILLGITHIIRGKELMIESEVEKFIWDIFGWKHPEIIHLGLFQIEGVKISKSKSREEVEKGIYRGWDDPRTWSLQSLRKRGIRSEAIREFILSLGVSKGEVKVPVDSLYSINRKLIDKEANRYFAVIEKVKLKIENLNEFFKESSIEVPNHPERKDKRKVGIDKQIFIERKDFEKFIGKEVRLLHFANIIFNEEGKAKITSLEVKKIPKVHWVASNFSIPIKIIMEDGSEKSAIAERNVENVKYDEVIQFERLFFARKDKEEFYYTHK